RGPVATLNEERGCAQTAHMCVLPRVWGRRRPGDSSECLLELSQRRTLPRLSKFETRDHVQGRVSGKYAFWKRHQLRYLSHARTRRRRRQTKRAAQPKRQLETQRKDGPQRLCAVPRSHFYSRCAGRSRTR